MSKSETQMLSDVGRGLDGRSVEWLRSAIRELECPDNQWASMGYSEAFQQARIDQLCRELGRRGED